MVYRSCMKPFHFGEATVPSSAPIRNGYYKSDSPLVRIPLKNVTYVVPENQKADMAVSIETIPMAMEANAALLVDTWSAQGPTMFKTQTRGLVPSSLLNNGLFDALRDVAGTILFEEKLKQPARVSQMAGISVGTVPSPVQYRCGCDEDMCDDNGVCSFTGNIHGEQYDNVN